MKSVKPSTSHPLSCRDAGAVVGVWAGSDEWQLPLSSRSTNLNYLMNTLLALNLL